VGIPEERPAGGGPVVDCGFCLFPASYVWAIRDAEPDEEGRVENMIPTCLVCEEFVARHELVQMIDRAVTQLGARSGVEEPTGGVPGEGAGLRAVVLERGKSYRLEWVTLAGR
jgi:hypothetical protein